MKTFNRHFSDIHVNPINRDLAVIAISGMLIAAAIATLFVMVVSQN